MITGLIAWLLGLSVLALTVLFIGHLLLMLLLIVPTWRICERAGFSGALSLLLLVPVVGLLVVMAVLAFSDWPNGEAPRQGR